MGQSHWLVNSGPANSRPDDLPMTSASEGPRPPPTAPARPNRLSLILFYSSHLLFTWNDRVWEFASVIFLIAAYPQTLQPSSIFGLVTTASAILFGPSVGRWFDGTDRLKAVRMAIFVQRVTVAIGCVLLWLMIIEDWSVRLKDGVFAVVNLLGCFARLAFVGKTASIERDWSFSRAGFEWYAPNGMSQRMKGMNAVMRRLDLFCKLAGPLFVSLLTIKSSSFSAIFLAASNIVSLPFEYFFIQFVYRRFPDLAVKHPRATPSEPLLTKIFRVPRRTMSSWKTYYHSPLFLASFALCTLYFTVLSFGGSMIAFLSQYSGFSTPLIAGLRAVAVIIGMVATFVAPLLIRSIGPIRGALWSLSWQTILLTPAVVSLFIPVSRVMQGGLLVGFVSISRLGLWSFDLCEQLLVQEEIDATIRGEFSTTESALQSFFDLCQYLSTIIFSKPEWFKYPVILSFASVAIALVTYSGFVRKRRGHLVHFYEKIVDR